MAKHKGGRPPFFKNSEELQKKIDEYIENCPEKFTILEDDGTELVVPRYTISGLAYFLGFTSRQSFYDYEKVDEFSYTIKRARFFIEKEYEKQLQNKSCAGIIFALKNLGWQDKQEIDTNIKSYSLFEQAVEDKANELD